MAHQSIRPLAKVLLATNFTDFRGFILKKSVRIREIRGKEFDWVFVLQTYARDLFKETFGTMDN